jgi:predicted DNA-binding transcriptional regulator AlpA
MKNLITLDHVCTLASISKPTLYRRLKKGAFPAPYQIPSTAPRGPRNLNRWDHEEVIQWLLAGNDPRWLKKWPEPMRSQLAATYNTSTSVWTTNGKIVLATVVGIAVVVLVDILLRYKPMLITW